MSLNVNIGGFSTSQTVTVAEFEAYVSQIKSNGQDRIDMGQGAYLEVTG